MAANPPPPPAKPPAPNRTGPGGKPQPPISPFAQFRSPRFWVTLGIVLALNILISQFLFQTPQPKAVTISYSTFLQQVTDNNVISITSVGTAITGTTKAKVKDVNTSDTATHFTTEIPIYVV